MVFRFIHLYGGAPMSDTIRIPNRIMSNEELHRLELAGEAFTVEAVKVLGKILSSQEDLSVLLKHDNGLYVGEQGNEKVFIKKVLARGKHDVQYLLDVLLEKGGEEKNRWTLIVRKAVADEIMSRVSDLMTLMLLFYALGEDVDPPDSEEDDPDNNEVSLHYRVFIKMVDACGEDLKQLFGLLKRFGGEKRFARPVLARINEIAKKK
jgi:hypothetical protein